MKTKNIGNSIGERLGVFTPEQLENEFKISLGTQNNWRAAKKIPYTRLGGKVLYFIDDVKNLLSTHKVESK